MMVLIQQYKVIIVTQKVLRDLYGIIKGDYNVMKQKLLEFDWDALIKREPDIDKACVNFTNVILSVSEECIPRREVTIRCNDKIWFDSNIRREIRKRDRFRRKYLKLKTA
jgi:hypothetical protein